MLVAVRLDAVQKKYAFLESVYRKSILSHSCYCHLYSYPCGQQRYRRRNHRIYDSRSFYIPLLLSFPLSGRRKDTHGFMDIPICYPIHRICDIPAPQKAIIGLLHAVFHITSVAGASCDSATPLRCCS